MSFKNEKKDNYITSLLYIRYKTNLNADTFKTINN